MLDVNILFIVIGIYIVLYYLVVISKPSIIYDKQHNGLRQFGIGYKNTTILPLWLVSILLAIISYFIVLYSIHLRYNTIFMYR